MNNYYFLYYFFDSPLIRWVRVLIFLGVGIFVYLNIEDPILITKLLPFYFLLILQEFFIHFKLENSHPKKTINDKTNHVIETVDYRLRSILERNSSIKKVIGKIKNDHEVKYFLKQLSLNSDNHSPEIEEEELLRKAFLIATQVGGRNIHPVDFFASYLILQDKTSKVLFNNKLTEGDIIMVLSWTRRIFRTDMKKHDGLNFTGSGVFDFFVYGWSQELSRYASNFTKEVLSGLHPEPIGRDREYDLLVTALSKNSSSNALIIGDAGVGKTTLISKLAMDSNLGILPRSVSNKLVFKFFPERLLAGISNQGDLEARLVNMLNELYHSGNIIVYIPNIENIFGGGGLNVDLSGVLIEYLRSNRIKIIGSTTEHAFKEFIFSKQEIKDLFDIVNLSEPDRETAIFMLLEKAYQLEKITGATITYGAVKEACTLSDSYLNDGTALPGRATKLLEDAISYIQTHGEKKLTVDAIQNFVQEKTKIVLSKPTQEESEKLLNLESEIHKTVVSQDEAVKAISDAMRRVRSGIKSEEKPIASFLFLGPTGVGKTETAKALAKTYFGDEKAMIRIDMSEYQAPDSLDRFLGSDNSQTIIDKILDNPFCEILLDEFEKANTSIHDLFLQVLDEGRLTDKLNRTASFKNTIIIATSNAGSEFIREFYKNEVPQEGFKDKLIEKLLQEKLFKPELLNRFDDLIVFKPLSTHEIVKVANLFLQEVVNEISNKQITLSYDNEVLEYIAKNSYSIEFGARNIKRFIQQSIENQLSKMILSSEVNSGESLRISVRDNNLVIEK